MFALQRLSGEQNMYKNEARKKGEVDVELPKDFKDLSTVHTPIGGLFESPKVAKEMTMFVYIATHFAVYTIT